MLTIYDGPAANNIILGSTNCVDGGGSPNISSTSSITIVLKAPTPASATPATFFLAISPTAANAPTTTTNQPITTPLNNGSSTCDTTKLNQCTQSFFKNFGTSQIPYSNETVFEMAFFNFLNVQGVDGWRQIREWMHTLITCTGGHHSFEACYNWNFLQTAWNIDVQNAKQWNIRLLNLDYDCGPGYEVMLQNFYCIEGVAAHEGPVIKSCQQTLQNEQNNQPNMTCQHVAEYLTCIERPYVTHCGRDAGGLICYGERIAYNIYFPQCTSQVALHCRNAPGKK
uniref:Uncharacterized protein n=1 Tax=Plectus sambesii TaxID=2011161 RepID=A0A914WW08_9BILA